MLVIRDAQVTALGAAVVDRFIERMVRHAETHFPDACRGAGREGTRRAVEHGVRRALGYGITACDEVCKYLNVMFVFGLRFDEDAELPWARAVLEDRGPPRKSSKVERLYATALRRAHLGRGLGPVPEDT